MEVHRTRGTATTILFPLIDRGTLDFESTPVSFVAADTQISKDEGSFANTGSTPSHEGNGIYSLALTATEMEAERIAITCIDAVTKEWEDQAILIQTRALAAVFGTRSSIDDTTPTTILFEAALGVSTVTGFYVGQFVIFDQDSANPGIGRRISNYAGGVTRRFSLTEALPVTPVDGDIFTIIGLQSLETAQAPRMV